MKQISNRPFLFLFIIMATWIPITALFLFGSSPYRSELSFLGVQTCFSLVCLVLLLRLRRQVGRWKRAAQGQEDWNHTKTELRKTKELLEAFLKHTPDAVSIVDVQGNVIRVNQAAVEHFGYSAEALIGKPLPCIPEDRMDEVEQYHRHVLEGNAIIGLETVRTHSNGTPIHISLSMAPVMDSEGKVVGIIGSSRDITERKLVEQRLQESEANYRLITENMTDLVFFYKKDGTVKYASASNTMLLGYPIEELVKMGPEALAVLVHPDDLGMVAKVFHNNWDEERVTTIVVRLRHREGHWVYVESSTKHIKDETGQVDSLLIVLRDVTEAIQTKELLRQTDKLSAIGQMAAGIAHEIRNPLTALRGFIQLLQASLEDKRYCEIMLSELDRINFIVSELLWLAKPQEVKYQVRDLSALVHDVLSLLDSQANLNNIQIHAQMESGMPLISCEENQLKQVFLNLCKNAIEAMPDGGEMFVDGKQISPSHVQVSIRDTGCGIDPNGIPRLGEPFYTTKEKGTGLGLMVSYRILEDHGGSIHIESEWQKGTTLYITLPVTSASA
jgi:PAS domain S-box-containing protein